MTNEKCCLSVFDYFVGMALKWLRNYSNILAAVFGETP